MTAGTGERTRWLAVCRSTGVMGIEIGSLIAEDRVSGADREKRQAEFFGKLSSRIVEGPKAGAQCSRDSESFGPLGNAFTGAHGVR